MSIIHYLFNELWNSNPVPITFLCTKAVYSHSTQLSVILSHPKRIQLGNFKFLLFPITVE